MKKIGKLTAVLAAISLFLTMFSACGGKPERDSSAKAEKYTSITTENPDNAYLSVSKSNAQPGDKQVSVTVSIRNNPGILSMTLSVLYDERVLTLTSAANGEAFQDILVLTCSNELKNGCKFLWDGVDFHSEDIQYGTVLTLAFDVAEDAKTGDYPITVQIEYGSVIDRDLSTVELCVINGGISIS